MKRRSFRLEMFAVVFLLGAGCGLSPHNQWQSLEYAFPFPNGYWARDRTGLWCLLDCNMKPLCNERWKDKLDMPLEHGTELVPVQTVDGLWGYVDAQGAYVLEPQFLEARRFFEGFAAVKRKDGWIFIDHHGQPLTERTCSWLSSFSEGLAVCYDDRKRKYTYMNKCGSIVGEYRFDDARMFSEGVAAVQVDGKWGYVLRNGMMAIDTIYDGAREFSEGLAWVVSKGRYGCIDHGGNIVVPFKYGYANPFSGGLAIVAIDGKYGMIDSDGKVVVDLKWADIAWPARLITDDHGQLFRLIPKSPDGREYGWELLPLQAAPTN